MNWIKKIVVTFAAATFCAFLFSLTIAAQSTDVNFPTSVTTNEIDGKIKARDIGDSRLTSYFYTFDGGQGDIFVNVVTKNLNGDIDVFASEGMRPLTKMVIYSDAGDNETGRLIYLRKPERLILRVEGRSPNDDPATFRIKFAGSFIALTNQKPQDAPAIKGSEIDVESGVRVNSVGTIVEVIPKPPPPVKAKPAEKEVVAVASKKKDSEAESKKPAKETESTEKVAKTETPMPPAKTPAAKTKTTEVARKEASPARKSTKKTDASEVKTIFKSPAKSKKPTAAERPPAKPAKTVAAPPEESKPNPLASIRLVVQLKDGKTIERPMSEVTKFGVDNGVLTVIAKDGIVVKYSILDVAKVTME